MCVCACARRLGRLSPQILSILLYLERLEGWLLQTFGWPLVCVAVWHPPRRNACNRRAPLIPSPDPFTRGLSSAPVVCLCLLFTGRSWAHSSGRPQSDSVHSSCHHFPSLSFIFFYFLRFSFGWSFKVIDCFEFFFFLKIFLISLCLLPPSFSHDHWHILKYFKSLIFGLLAGDDGVWVTQTSGNHLRDPQMGR